MKKEVIHKPKYYSDDKCEVELTPQEILDSLEIPGVDGVPVYLCWQNIITGNPTNLEYFVIELSCPQEHNQPRIVFKVPVEYSSTGKVTKWKIRGTVALSSFKVGRVCIGCEGVPYTKRIQDKIERETLLNSPKAEENLVTSKFKHLVKRS